MTAQLTDTARAAFRRFAQTEFDMHPQRRLRNGADDDTGDGVHHAVFVEAKVPRAMCGVTVDRDVEPFLAASPCQTCKDELVRYFLNRARRGALEAYGMALPPPADAGLLRRG